MTGRVLTVAALLLAAAPAAADEAFARTAAPFLKQHCVGCHGAAKQEGGVRLDQADAVTPATRTLWGLVHQKVSSGAMPPEGRDPPPAADRDRLLAFLRDQERALGIAGTRRLNRRELGAALRDVTGLSVDFAQALPADGTVAGFDTGAAGLQEAPDGVALWLAVTRRAVDGVRFLDPPRGKTFAADLLDTKDARKVFDAWKAHGGQARELRGIARPGLGLLMEPRAAGDREELTFVVPPPAGRPGVLRVTAEVAAFKPMPGLPNSRLWVRAGGKDIDFVEVTGTPDRPQRLAYQVHTADLAVQAKGVTVALSNKVELPYAVAGFENDDRSNPKDPVPGGTGLFRPVFDRKLPPEQQPAPFVALRRVTVEPDHVAPWPPAEWKADVGEAADTPVYADRLLALWVERAWRRPATAAERAPFLALYQKQRDSGLSFDAALRAAFQSVLMSAPFRYTPSPAHPDPATAQHAAAARLSFMFWGAPPDAELRALAAAGKLRDPAVLAAQAERLLADPRSDAFVRPFVTQWLLLEQPITIAQDHIQKQDFRFARYLRASMREETVGYVARLIADNRPAAELVQSDWTMMNDALARHYDYPGVACGDLRKVTLRPDDPRGGGLLGHAGVQSMLCWMGDNWVIYRGAWALRHVLDHPPPPPPLEVPELNPAEGKNKGRPFRELLKQHQADGRCSVCHRTIDPVGFAFQNFDISGRWRAVEHEHYARGELDGRISWVGVGKTRPVDTVGRLPRGEEFRTFAEFKQQVVAHYQADVVRGLAKNLFVYATGRPPGIDDTAEITAILEALRPRGYPLRDLVTAVVRARAFRDDYETPTPTPGSPR